MDGDVFTRKVRRVWKRVADGLGSKSDPRVCAHALEAAMAAHLRESGGLTGIGLPQDVASDDATTDRVIASMQETWRAEVVERVAPILVGHGVFETYDDVQQFVDRINTMTRWGVLAGSLLRRPDGRGLRRPSHSRQGRAALLTESAPLGPRA